VLVKLVHTIHRRAQARPFLCRDNQNHVIESHWKGVGAEHRLPDIAPAGSLQHGSLPRCGGSYLLLTNGLFDVDRI
jgi:hypothetical protein